MKLRILDFGIYSGKFNMETDIRLAQSSIPDEIVLRFYRWEPFCISLGANQSLNEINIHKAQQDGIETVYRPTGGRAILHSEELTYSVVYPIDTNVSSRAVYHQINAALLKGLSIYNDTLTQSELETTQPDFQNFYKHFASAICFAVPAKSEVKYQGKKLIGSAQKRFQHAILQHGSILCGDYHLKIVDYLNLPEEKVFLMREELKNRTTDLYSILKEEVNYQRLMDSLILGFHEHFAIIQTSIAQ